MFGEIIETFFPPQADVNFTVSSLRATGPIGRWPETKKEIYPEDPVNPVEK